MNRLKSWMVGLCLVSNLPLVKAQGTQQKDPVDWVNPLMGTDSKFELSNGNTYPAIARPWGMHFWTPQTGPMGNGWIYQYSADKIRGFKQTHQPSPWMNDYGQFSIMPVTKKQVVNENDRASWFSHKAETVTPYFYQVYLADHDVQVSFTTTERAAMFEFQYPDTDSSFLVLDAFDKGSYVKVLPQEQKIIGYSTKNSGGVHAGFRNYFVLQFDQPFTVAHAWSGNRIATDTLEYRADHVGAIVGFSTRRSRPLQVKAASSFVSAEQAALNLSREIGSLSFKQLVDQSKKAWNEVLGKVQLEGGEEKQFANFYSCLYRTVLFPQKHYELDANNERIHYSPIKGTIEKGYYYAGTGFWDTFRALYPLLNLLYPSINREMQEGLANAYREGGFLPEWSSPGYRDIMIGNNSASVVSDAYIKGLRNYPIDELYQALLHGANNEGPIGAVGRKGVAYYNRLGYVPYDVKIHENAARTLEYAYNDFTIYTLGKKLGRPKEEWNLYARRSMNYKNLLDPSTGWMRGKNEDGKFQVPFNPLKWGDAFTEGNSWHYTWSVFHDMAGLIKLMGGKTNFINKLDSVFTSPPDYDESYYGQVIHEIREMQVMNMGQYAHGNQPIQHLIYLYNYAGQPWKSQYWAREVMEKLYLPTPDGYCGDEDNGQTSAWYVFSALGFYPVCPGTDQYVIGSPLFKKATLTLEGNKKLVLQAPQNSGKNKYINRIMVGGKPYQPTWFSHADLLKGGVIRFDMQSTPNTGRGVEDKDHPYSISVEDAADLR